MNVNHKNARRGKIKAGAATIYTFWPDWRLIPHEAGDGEYSDNHDRERTDARWQ
jgi:hypothetical protein